MVQTQSQGPSSERPELIGGSLEECLRNCRACEAECRALATRCPPELEIALLDCADACRVAIAFMQRGSPAHTLYCGACAEVSLRCAEECQRHPDDERVAHCAEVCRQCVDSCRQMAGESGAV
jgi:hypothetical protein